MTKRFQHWTIRVAKLCVFPVTWIAGVAAALSPVSQRPAQAQVVATPEGAGTTVTESGDQFDIAGGTQAGGNLFHEFEQFDLSEEQTANFTSDSGVFNIVGQISEAAPSYIDGTVQVSGSDANLYLVNPSGVLFGPNAQLSLGGSFTATTADQVEFNGDVLNVLEQSADYAALNADPTALHFTQDTAGTVVNHADLTVEAGESLSLVGGSVVNTGRLEAPGGEIGLVAVGGNSTVTLATPGSLLSMEVNAAEFEMELNVNDGFEATELPVLLTGGADQSAESLTVNNDGSVTLGGTAVEDGTVAVTGEVSVSSETAAGGSVALVGESVAVIEAQIDASGTTGGTVRIGGDYRGEGTLPVATQVSVDEDSVVSADGTAGDGGSVVVFAQEEAIVQGRLSATGATTGGLVETSADYLTVAGAEIDTSGEEKGGRWLVDPIDVEIVSTATGSNQIEASAIESQIDSGSDFILETSGAGSGNGDIDLRTSINQTNAASTGGLTLRGRRFEDNGHDIDLEGSGTLQFDINMVNPEANPTSQSIVNAVDAIGNVNGDRIINLGAADYSFNNAINLDTDVEIRGTGPSSTRLTTVQAGTHMFRVESDVEASLSGLMLTTSGLSSSDVGGGIVNVGGSLTVDNAHFVDNRATQNGGAIDSYAGGTLTIRNSEFRDNRSASNGSGGAIHIGNSSGVNRISSTVFEGNSTANSGGAINVFNSSLLIDAGDSSSLSTRTTFDGNCAVADCIAGSAGGRGGAIAVQNGEVSLIDAVLDGNSAINGGGIAAFNGSTVNLHNTTLENNRAILVGSGVGDGGGIWAQNSTLTIDNNSPILGISNNSLFKDNIAASRGGGIYLEGNGTLGIANIAETTFQRNFAQQGGGISAINAALNISSNSLFDANQTTIGEGGGVYLVSGLADIDNTEFSNNRSFDDGGGFSMRDNSTVTLENSQFSDNAATDDGGGIHISAGSNATIVNVQLENNNATDDGGGIHISAGSNATIDTVELTNNTAVDSGGGINITNNSSATLIDVGFTANAASIGGGLSTIRSTVTATSRAVPVGDPIKGVFRRNHASALPRTEPINVGSNPATTYAGGGIFQSGGSLTLSNINLVRNESAGDGGGLAVTSSATTTINANTEFVRNAAIGNGGGLYTESTGTLTVNDSSLSQNHADLSGGAIYEDSTAAIDIVNTNAVSNTANGDGGALSVGSGGVVTIQTAGIGSNVAQGSGGAIAIRDTGEVIISSTSLSENQAMTGVGGAIANDSDTGRFEITNSSVNSNTATEGGAIYTTADSLSTITAVGIEENEAEGGDGGGLYISEDSGLTLERVGIRRNEADDQGGGIYYDADRALSISTSTLEGNQARSDGGAIANNSDSATLSISNSTFNANITQEEGGAIFAGRDTNTTITASDLINNRAEGANSIGGAIAISNSGNATLTDTHVQGNYAREKGGGIHLSGDSVASVSGTLSTNAEGVVTSSTSRFENNIAGSDGGGIVARDRAQLSVEGILFKDNSSGDDGGGVAVTESSEATITNSNFENNHADHNGGGLYGNTIDPNATSSTDIRVTNSRFIANDADNGGGGLFQGQLGSATVSNSTFRANEAVNSGGGVHVGVNGTLALTSSTLEGNQANAGGGLSNLGSTELVNVTVSGNTASGLGGAVQNSGPDASLTVRSSTLTNNQAGTQGGGIAEVSAQLTRLQNTIVARNTGAAGADVSGRFDDSGNNLIGTSAGATGFTNSWLVGSGTNLIDPQLASLANNGGPTKTHLLLANSLAINTGSTANLPTVDQRGLARVTDNAADIGSVELSATEAPDIPAGEFLMEQLGVPDPTFFSNTFGDLDSLLARRISYNIDESNRSISRMERSFSQSFEDYWDLSAGPDMTFDDVQAILRRAQEEYKANSAVIYAVFAPENAEDDESSILRIDPTPADDDLLNLSVVLPEGELVSYELPVTRKEALRQVRYFRTAAADEYDSRGYQPLAQQMYQWLLAPIEKDLAAQNIQNLMYALDSGLRSAPITAMRDYDGFSLERYGISQVPSMGLMQADFPVAVRRATVAMGVSEFDTQSPLPAVPIELAVVDQFVPVSQTALNESTTLDTLKSVQALEQPGILHLATHASFDRRSPEDSLIHLWDEPLSMKEFSTLDWENSDLEMLILSACSTALGSRNSELGFAGLAAASGVDATVGSLWDVSDVGTLALMSEFYAQLEKTDLRFEALRRAQLALLNGDTRIENGNLLTSHGEVALPDDWNMPASATLDHPYFWSAFTMVGNPW